MGKLIDSPERQAAAPTPVVLDALVGVDDDTLMQLSADNPNCRLERNADGSLTVMAPSGSNASKFNFKVSGCLYLWYQQTRLGEFFESSSGFSLPDGAVLSPDCSWITSERWNALSAKQQKGFAPLAPDFVVEIRSPSDRWDRLQSKMRQWLENGTRLGWLIDPERRIVEVSVPGKPVVVLNDPAEVVADESVLPGFVLPIGSLW